MTRPKSHLELYGWEIRRCSAPAPWNAIYPGRFDLFLPWSKFPAASGPLPYIALALDRFFDA